MVIPKRFFSLPLLFAAFSLGTLSGAALSAPAVFSDGVAQGGEERLTLNIPITIATEDIEKNISYYVLAIVPSGGKNAYYARTVDGWIPVASTTVPKYAAAIAQPGGAPLEIVRDMDVRALPGTTVLVGYGLENNSGESSFSEMVRSKRYRLVYTFGKSSSANTNQGSQQSGPSYVAACPADVATPLFGTSPVALEDFISFRPLGFMSTPIHMFPAKHSAFSMTQIGATAVPKPVRAPSKATVTEIYEATFSATGKKNYQIFMHPCREVRAYFGHAVTISDKLAAEFAKETPKCNSFDSGDGSLTTTCRRENLNISLEEGEIFGSGPDTAGIDFGTLDFRRKPAAFIDITHYDSYYPYYASPLDYFKADVKAQIEAKTGSVFGAPMRTALPIGGTYMQDIPGTAQGNWFLPGKYHSNSTDLSQFMGLVHDYVDPTQPLMSAGASITGMKLGLYTFKPESSGLTNRDFNAITPDGNTYCYDGFINGQSAGGLPVGKPSGVLLMTMPDAKTLKVELVSGSTCAALTSKTLSAGATTFVR
jgi:hypothetical protein